MKFHQKLATYRGSTHTMHLTRLLLLLQISTALAVFTTTVTNKQFKNNLYYYFPNDYSWNWGSEFTAKLSFNATVHSNSCHVFGVFIPRAGFLRTCMRNCSNEFTKVNPWVYDRIIFSCPETSICTITYTLTASYLDNLPITSSSPTVHIHNLLALLLIFWRLFEHF